MLLESADISPAKAVYESTQEREADGRLGVDRAVHGANGGARIVNEKLARV